MNIEPPGDTAAEVNAWAAARQAEGDLEGALLGFMGAVTLAIQEFGKDNPIVATLLNNAANVQLEMGNFKAALEEYQMAERIESAANGPMHHKVGDRIYRVGIAYDRLGDKWAARVCYEQAFGILARTRGIGGEDTMEVAVCLVGVGGDPVGYARSMGAPEGVVNALVAELQRIAAERSVN